MQLTEAYDYYYWHLFQPWTLARILNECLRDFEPRSSIDNRYEFRARLSKSISIRIIHAYKKYTDSAPLPYIWIASREIWLDDLEENKTNKYISDNAFFGEISEPRVGRKSLVLFLNLINDNKFPAILNRICWDYRYRMRRQSREYKNAPYLCSCGDRFLTLEDFTRHQDMHDFLNLSPPIEAGVFSRAMINHSIFSPIS